MWRDVGLACAGHTKLADEVPSGRSSVATLVATLLLGDATPLL